MGDRFRPRSPKPLTLRKQQAHLRVRWPQLECRILDGNKLVCEGWLQPEPGCSLYLVRITLKSGYHHPSVRVLEPALCRRSEDEVIPHVFDEAEDPTPCLYHHHEWHASARLADTIVPWLLEWLLFYELWHVTGEWYGGGIDHESGPKETA